MAAIVAVKDDPIVAMEADRPVRLELDQLGQHDLLAEVPVEELGVQRSHDIAELKGLVAPQARHEVNDAQGGKRIAAPRELGRCQGGVRHPLGSRTHQRCAHRTRIGQFVDASPTSIGTPTSEPYSVHEPS